MNEELHRYKITIDLELGPSALHPRYWDWDEVIFESWAEETDKINGVWVEEVDLEAPLG